MSLTFDDPIPAAAPETVRPAARMPERDRELRQPWHARGWPSWLLCQVTVGIWCLVWSHRLHRRLDALEGGAARTTRRALLANTLGGLLVVPLVLHLRGVARRVREAQVRHGLAPDCRGGAVVLLAVLACLHVVYLQRRLDRLAAAA